MPASLRNPSSLRERLMMPRHTLWITRPEVHLGSTRHLECAGKKEADSTFSSA